ncbi:MAG: hypothetical protein AB1705_00770 [Verrucomicrobiota bacterium]
MEAFWLNFMRIGGRIMSAFGLWEALLRMVAGPRITAVAFLTLKAAFRYRVVLAVSALLVATVVGLPLIIKDDGTARGMTQIVLTYTLGTITALLGFVTLWLGCGTLAKDIEECQMQVVAVKPIARWEIWLGKWLGILLLNAGLLGYSGLAVYLLIQYRSHKLPELQQTILRNEVLVGRKSAKEPVEDVEPEVERIFAQRIKDEKIARMDHDFVRKEIREMVRAAQQVVQSNHLRRWQIQLGDSPEKLRDRPFSIRIKFHAARVTSQTIYNTRWMIGPPETKDYGPPIDLRLAVDTFHEIPIPPNKFDDQGVLTVEFWNYNPDALLFPLEDGMEILYRESGFGLNFVRGLVIVFLWLALLAALGLASASYLSFPVAAFTSLAILLIGLSSGTLSTVVKEGTIAAVDHETGLGASSIDFIMVPIFKALLNIINLVQGFSPIDYLSSGRSVTWGLLGLAIAQIGLIMTGTFILAGIAFFYRRELATAQSNTVT